MPNPLYSEIQTTTVIFTPVWILSATLTTIYLGNAAAIILNEFGIGENRKIEPVQLPQCCRWLHGCGYGRNECTTVAHVKY